MLDMFCSLTKVYVYQNLLSHTLQKWSLHFMYVILQSKIINNVSSLFHHVQWLPSPSGEGPLSSARPKGSLQLPFAIRIPHIPSIPKCSSFSKKAMIIGASVCFYMLFPLLVVNLSPLPCPTKLSLTLSDEKPLLLQAPTGLHAPIFVSCGHFNKLPQTGWL